MDSEPNNPEQIERRISVAYVVYNFEMGGLERCVARLVNALDRSRFQSCIMCLGHSGSAAEWVDARDVEIVELHKKPGNDLRVVRSLAVALKERRIDIVHSHNWGTLLETTLARRQAGTPIHLHAERGMELAAMQVAPWKRWLRSRATRWALERTDYVLAVAEAVREQVIERCGHLKKEVYVVPNGVDAPPVDDNGPSAEDIRRQLQIPSGSIVAGSVGRFVAVKDFGIAIEAIARLVQEERPIHLLLVGDGPERDALEEKAKAENIDDRVHFVGQRHDVRNWLAAMDIYINCSLNEGMSQSVLEAMACGLPLVVTDVGDNALLAGGESFAGHIVQPGDAKRFADAMLPLIDDASHRRDCSRNSLSRHHHDFSLQRMIDHYEAIYEKLMTCISSEHHCDRHLEATS